MIVILFNSLKYINCYQISLTWLNQIDKETEWLSVSRTGSSRKGFSICDHLLAHLKRYLIIRRKSTGNWKNGISATYYILTVEKRKQGFQSAVTKFRIFGFLEILEIHLWMKSMLFFSLQLVFKKKFIHEQPTNLSGNKTIFFHFASLRR